MSVGTPGCPLNGTELGESARDFPVRGSPFPLATVLPLDTRSRAVPLNHVEVAHAALSAARDPPRACPHCGRPLRASAAVEHLACWRKQRTRIGKTTKPTKGMITRRLLPLLLT